METIKVKTDSWHYRLNSKFNDMWRIHDSCQYNRATFASLVLCAIILLLGTLVLLLLGDMVGSLVAFIVTGIFIFELLVTPIVLAVAIFLFFLTHYITREKEYKEPSSVKLLYESFKEKFCKPVDFV